MAAGPRAYWKGFLRLSLVSIAVELYAATSTTDTVSFHQIHKPTGKRIRYEKVVPGVGPVDSDDIVKGYEVDADTYVILEPDELDAIKLESKRTIDLVQFVDQDEIDPRYFERPYYLLPEGDVSTEGYCVIRDALAATGKVGLGQMTLRGREYVVGIKALERGLLLETLRYANEIRASEPIFRDIEEPRLDAEMVSLAHELIERKAHRFDPRHFKDHYGDALRALIEEKRKGHTITTAHEQREPRSGNVIDLMAALRKSVAQDGGDKPKKPLPAAKARVAARAAKTAAEPKRQQPRRAAPRKRAGR